MPVKQGGLPEHRVQWGGLWSFYSLYAEDYRSYWLPAAHPCQHWDQGFRVARISPCG